MTLRAVRLFSPLGEERFHYGHRRFLIDSSCLFSSLLLPEASVWEMSHQLTEPHFLFLLRNRLWHGIKWGQKQLCRFCVGAFFRLATVGVFFFTIPEKKLFFNYPLLCQICSRIHIHNQILFAPPCTIVAVDLRACLGQLRFRTLCCYFYKLFQVCRIWMICE